MKNLLTTLFCIVSLAAFSQSFNTTYPYYGYAYGDQVDLEETGYRVMGFGKDISGGYVLVIHTDFYGDTLQTRKLYLGFEDPRTLRMVTDQEGNHYVNLPYNADSISIVKLSPDWVEVWRKSLTTKTNEVTSMLVTGDNHIIAAASKRLFKLDTDGNIIWQQNYGEAIAVETRGHSMREVTNGDLFLYGYDKIQDGFNTTYEPKLRIFSQNGEMKDSTLLPINTGSSISYGNDYICIGNNFTSFPRNLLYRHDINGLIFQEREILLGEKVRLYSMVENHEGNLVAVGNGEYDLVLHCMTKEGDSLWTRFINKEKKAVPMDMKLAADGGYVISYFREASYGSIYPGLIKTDAMGNISGLGFEKNNIAQKVKVYPNPASEYVVFGLEKPLHSTTITVTDICGRQIATIALTGERTVWQTAEVKPGFYLYKLESKESSSVGKFLISR